jgi:hypothetical protein
MGLFSYMQWDGDQSSTGSNLENENYTKNVEQLQLVTFRNAPNHCEFLLQTAALGDSLACAAAAQKRHSRLGCEENAKRKLGQSVSSGR